MTIWMPTVALKLAGLHDPSLHPAVIRTPDAYGWQGAPASKEPTTLLSGRREALVALVTDLQRMADEGAGRRKGDRMLFRLALAFASVQGIEPSVSNRDSDDPK